MELQPFVDCLKVPLTLIMIGSFAVGLLQLARKHRPKHVTHEKIPIVNMTGTISPKIKLRNNSRF